VWEEEEHYQTANAWGVEKYSDHPIVKSNFVLGSAIIKTDLKRALLGNALYVEGNFTEALLGNPQSIVPESVLTEA